MAQTGSPGPPQANASLLHTMLGLGQLVVVVALVVMRFAGVGSGESPDEATNMLGYAMSAVSVVMVIVAVGFLKPRVHERGPGQSVAQFWADPAVTARVMPVWFLLEGAAVTAAVAYFLSGLALSALMIAVAIGAFWLANPNSFAKG